MTKIVYIILGAMSVLCAIGVISTKNPVYSVLYLILVFVNIMGMIILLGLDFLGLIVVLVYGGAVAVLFLFIVMMLNVKVVEISASRFKYMPLGFSALLLLLLEIFTLYDNRRVLAHQPVGFENEVNTSVSKYLNVESNIEVLGSILYSNHVYYFMIAGVILLLAMIGAICVTYSQDVKIKKQIVYDQLKKDYNAIIRK